MSNFGFNVKRMNWVVSNLGMVIRVLIFLLLVISLLVLPQVVLAEPAMGGSVGSVSSIFSGLKGI